MTILKIDGKKIIEGIKNTFIPKNIIEKIKMMPTMEQIYWSKVITAIITGIIFGLINFVKWPAVLTMIVIYMVISSIWAFTQKDKLPGVKIRTYYTKGMMQFFITMIVVWALLFNIMMVPEPTEW